MCYSHGYLLGSPGGGMAAVQSVLWSISVGQCIVAHKVLLYRLFCCICCIDWCSPLPLVYCTTV